MKYSNASIIMIASNNTTAKKQKLNNGNGENVKNAKM